MCLHLFTIATLILTCVDHDPISWHPCLTVNMDAQVKGCLNSNSFSHRTYSYLRGSKPNFALN